MARRKHPKVAADSSGESVSKIVGHLPGTASVMQRVEQVISQQTSFQGPIPHPDIFRQYGEVIPDAPERILRVFEEDSKHAREIQMAALIAQKDDNGRLHWMAWSLVVMCFVLAMVFALLQMQTLAGIVLATTIVAIVTGFFQGKSSEKKSSDKQ